MTFKEVWEKYKHMDSVLSDGDIYEDHFPSQIIADLWAAIKEALRKEKGD